VNVEKSTRLNMKEKGRKGEKKGVRDSTQKKTNGKAKMKRGTRCTKSLLAVVLKEKRE